MRTITSYHAQRGITLLVALIMLVLMTLIAISAFTISNSNLKSVANMQSRNEMIAAGNKAVEVLLSSPFTDSPAAQSYQVDINNDGNPDYTVNIAQPTCVRASIESAAGLSSITLSPTMTNMANWETLWQIEAVVSGPTAGTNTTTVRSGVRVLLTQAKKNAVCP